MSLIWGLEPVVIASDPKFSPLKLKTDWKFVSSISYLFKDYEKVPSKIMIKNLLILDIFNAEFRLEKKITSLWLGSSIT